ncbi:dienelactone hydrolase family protein [Pseudomonas sp. UL073]|uniref:Dienelactone hydrolase family protein n=1 Tax=Zestomonas insulae TaxID=2809017 RepID=A0ABS2IM13_9GAMM|nr:dienelactone hydrolase family protein [Pseudomonas insulae]
MAAAHSWRGAPLAGTPFRLQSYAPDGFVAGAPLTVYIEGDGFSWRTSRQPSQDPTPIDPLALRLALAQPDGNAAYLGRPCQYLDADRAPCSQRYWTEARFAAEVVASLDQALSQLKQRAGAEQLVLVGYSGGAALALLLAARRTDVAQVISVAGNLDHAAWTAYHRVQPLRASLNPHDQLAALASVPQRHLLGGADTVMPAALGAAFVADLPRPNAASSEVFADFDHHCCWVEQWPQLWPRLRISPAR